MSTQPNRGLLVVAVMMATIMEVLDMTIINVSLPSIGGELSATPSQTSWALTSYIVAAAIAMPLTGFFSDAMGRKVYLMLSMALFILASMLCGLSTSLPALVLFRLIQGLSGAALVPISQAVMIDLYPPEQRGKAMALWASGIMVAPILGPVIGGWLTDNLSWRWAFFINLPVGLAALWLTGKYMLQLPHQPRKMDWLGFIAMLLAVGGLQYCLDKGNEDDWFDSVYVRWMTAISVIGFIWLGLHIARTKQQPIFSARLFTDRNFMLSSVAMVAVSIGLFGSITLQPLYFQQVLGYTTTVSGQFMIPRGIASMLSMMIVSQLVNKVDGRILISFGAIVGAIGSWGMTLYPLQANSMALIWPTLCQGLGMGFIFIPLNGIAYATLPPQMITEASGVYSLIRTIGNAIGISVVIMVYTRGLQQSWNQLVGFITPYNGNVDHYLEASRFSKNGVEGLGLLARELAYQAQALALLDAMYVTAISFVLIFPFLIGLKRPRNPAAGPAGH